MEGWQIALLVLVSVLVGALIPLLVQLYATLRTLRAVIEKSAKDVESALVGIHRTADRLDRLGAALEKDGKMAEIVEGATSAAQMVSQFRGTMQVAGPVAAAVVPAVMAAVRAWKGAMHEDPSPEAPEDSPAPESSPREKHERKEAAG
jgi:predicted Holliday junction resolvase-like endonuclease